MKYIHLIYIFALAITLSACAVEPIPINYGQDACHSCKMNIIDRQHAAEIVTTKGKAYKYDAVECMMQDLNNWQKDDLAFFLITDYSTPGKLIDARKATYLISEKLPSPMGANLTGFETKEAAELILKDKGGILLNWVELVMRFK